MAHLRYGLRLQGLNDLDKNRNKPTKRFSLSLVNLPQEKWKWKGLCKGLGSPGQNLG